MKASFKQIFLNIFITLDRNTTKDKFPIVPPSIQPFVLAISTGATLFLCVLTLHKIDYKSLEYGRQLVTGCQGHLISFSCQIINLGLEGRQGYHPPETQKILRSGFKLFIVSEVIFFASFFGVFFLNKFLLSDHEDTGQRNVDALVAPTINTIILVVSGFFAGQAHGVFSKKQDSFFKKESWDIGGGLIIAILLGLFFTKIQLDEYATTAIRISDGVFGGVFYVATGFHGIHVLIGSLFLLVILIRYLFGYLTVEIGYVGFDCAVQYQHFVDAIWIGLYCIIYLQGA